MKKMKTQDNMKMVVRTETAIAVANRILLGYTGRVCDSGQPPLPRSQGCGSSFPLGAVV